MKTLIGISGNERVMVDSDAHWISYTPKNFVDGIQAAGGTPVIFPISSPEEAETYLSLVDKLLLTGGQDLDPQSYQEGPHQKLGATDPARDQFELALVKAAVKQQKPIFAVCRGMQLLNVAFGGTLYQDLSLFPQETLKHVQVPTPFHFATHQVKIEPDTRLAKIVGEDYQVNSFHHQLIKKVADEFMVTALAPDGVVEGLESPTKPIMGIQWHPELTRETIPTEQKLFDYFVNQL